MPTSKNLVNEAASRIVDVIVSRAGGPPPPAVSALRRLCRHEFGVPARAIYGPVDFFGQVSGDIGGDNAEIIFNANQPSQVQIRVIIHELAEYLAARDVPGLWEDRSEGPAFVYTGPEAAEDVRHNVAVAVEEILVAQMGLEDIARTDKSAKVARQMPLDQKYRQPRPEIERVPADE
jgi:hypothetical protein